MFWCSDCLTIANFDFSVLMPWTPRQGKFCNCFDWDR